SHRVAIASAYAGRVCCDSGEERPCPGRSGAMTSTSGQCGTSGWRPAWSAPRPCRRRTGGPIPGGHQYASRPRPTGTDLSSIPSLLPETAGSQRRNGNPAGPISGDVDHLVMERIGTPKSEAVSRLFGRSDVQILVCGGAAAGGRGG